MRLRLVMLATLAALAWACGSGDTSGRDASAGDGDSDSDSDSDADADADADSDADADADSDADADADSDADSDADADTDADGDADGEVVIGGSMSPWGELDDGGELLVYEGHQGLSHFLSAIKERGLVIDPGVTAVYSLTPAFGGPTIVQPGAEIIQIAAFEFEPLDDGYMAAASGMHFVVLDQPQPELMEGETWVVSVEVTDAVGDVYADTREVIVHAVPL